VPPHSFHHPFQILGPDGMALVAWWALSIIFGVALYWRLACKSKGSSTGGW
jgi:hypothetical protein